MHRTDRQNWLNLFHEADEPALNVPYKEWNRPTARALYDYVPAAADELHIADGDEVVVITRRMFVDYVVLRG